jgi:hypothetical protein
MWFCCIVTQSRANFPHDVINVALGIDKEIRAPQFSDDIFAGNQLLSPPNQKDQELHGFLFKLYPAPTAAKLVTTQIELNGTQFKT